MRKLNKQRGNIGGRATQKKEEMDGSTQVRTLK